jgi:hypothetical protein
MLGGNAALRFPLTGMYLHLHALLLYRDLSSPLSAHFTIILHFFKDLIKDPNCLQIVAVVDARRVESGRLSVNVVIINF